MLLPLRWVHHPVHGAGPAVIGPPRHHGADVHHEGACQWRDVEPLPGLVADLQPAWGIVLVEHRQTADIDVRVGAEGTAPASLWLGRVVVDRQGTHMAVELV